MVNTVKLLLCVSVLFPFSIHAEADALKIGIFGIKWGAILPYEEGLKEISIKDDIRYYAKPDVVYSIHDIVIPDVILGFYLKQFFAVYINFDSWEAFTEIDRYLKSNYGTPKMHIERSQTVYVWKDEEIKIKLKLPDKGSSMKLSFYYTPLSNLINESRQEKFIENSVRFLPIDKDKRPKAIPLLTF